MFTHRYAYRYVGYSLYVCVCTPLPLPTTATTYLPAALPACLPAALPPCPTGAARRPCPPPQGVGYFIGAASVSYSYPFALGLLLGMIVAAMPWAATGLSSQLGRTRKVSCECRAAVRGVLCCAARLWPVGRVRGGRGLCPRPWCFAGLCACGAGLAGGAPCASDSVGHLLPPRPLSPSSCPHLQENLTLSRIFKQNYNISVLSLSR